MDMTTIKENTIILGKTEFELMVFSYLKHMHKIEIAATPDDIHLRVLVGESRAPAKPNGLRIKWKELE